MLRMKSRKRTKKMRGGGIFGPEFGGHVRTAGEDAQKGWFHVTTGLAKGNEVRKQAQQDYTDAYKQQRSQSMGGLPPEPTTNVNPIARLAMLNLGRRKHGELAPQVAAQYRDAGEGSQRTTSENPLTSSPVHTGHVRPSGNRDVRQKLQFGGKRKTKKRRRKRKKKKTKRKKRRRKRKTKKRKRRR